MGSRPWSCSTCRQTYIDIMLISNNNNNNNNDNDDDNDIDNDN